MADGVPHKHLASAVVVSSATGARTTGPRRPSATHCTRGAHRLGACAGLLKRHQVSKAESGRQLLVRPLLAQNSPGLSYHLCTGGSGLRLLAHVVVLAFASPPGPRDVGSTTSTLTDSPGQGTWEHECGGTVTSKRPEFRALVKRMSLPRRLRRRPSPSDSRHPLLHLSSSGPWWRG